MRAAIQTLITLILALSFGAVIWLKTLDLDSWDWQNSIKQERVYKEYGFYQPNSWLWRFDSFESRFPGADLRLTGFFRPRFVHAQFVNSDLSGATFYGAVFRDVSFANSNLNAVHIDSSDFIGLSVTGTSLRQAVITDSLFKDCILEPGALASARWINVHFENCQGMPP